jgi:murein DD-endopeptidase MepM/ murein hydrolase activator NlpD
VHTGITRLLNPGLRFTAICVGLICTSAFAVELSGTAMQGQVIFGQTSPGAKVSLDDRAVMVSPEGQFVIGFGRDQTGSQTLAISLPSGGSETHVLDIAPREYNIERVDGLPPSTVTPDPSALDRIRQEAKMVASARERRDERTDFAQGFDWPARGRISGVYGSQRVLNGEPRRPHFGLDIAAPEGSPVYAPAPGIITLTHPDMYFSGGTIILDHGHGLSSTFLHLSEVLVEAGTRVDKGLLIGRVGSTGRASGPHLDWRMNWLDKRVDPQQLVSGLPVAGKD